MIRGLSGRRCDSTWGHCYGRPKDRSNGETVGATSRVRGAPHSQKGTARCIRKSDEIVRERHPHGSMLHIVWLLEYRTTGNVRRHRYRYERREELGVKDYRDKRLGGIWNIK